MLLDQMVVKKRATMRAKYASNVDLVTPFTRPLSVSCLSAISHMAGCLDDAKHVITRILERKKMERLILWGNR